MRLDQNRVFPLRMLHFNILIIFLDNGETLQSGLLLYVHSFLIIIQKPLHRILELYLTPQRVT